MARIRLDLPEIVHYTTSIPVRITDINYGGHLGNDALLSLIHEARVRFFAHYGYSESDVEGVAIIMNDAAIVYKSEAYYGDNLQFRISAVDFHRFGCDLFYRITKEQNSGDNGTAFVSETTKTKEIARAKTGIIFYDYAQKKLVEVPVKFRAQFESVPRLV